MAKEKDLKARAWLPKKDAARYLYCSLRCIENYVNAGLITAYKLGGKIFFDRYELDEVIVDIPRIQVHLFRGKEGHQS